MKPNETTTAKMCLPNNNVRPLDNDPAIHGSNWPPTAEEMRSHVLALQGNVDRHSLSRSFQIFGALVGCPAHARVLYGTEGAVDVLVSCMREERCINVKTEAAGILRDFTDPDIHDGREHARVYDHNHYIQAVVRAGGVEAATEEMLKDVTSETMIANCLQLLSNLVLQDPGVSTAQFDATLNGVLEIMTKYHDNDNLIQCSIGAMYNSFELMGHNAAANISQHKNRALEKRCVEIIVKSMKNNMDSKSGVINCLQTLFYLVGDAAAVIMVKCDGFKVVGQAMRKYADDASISAKGCLLLQRFALSQFAPPVIIKEGLAQCAIDAMNKFPDVIGVQVVGCMALWNIGSKEGKDNHAHYTLWSGSKMGALAAILQAMRLHPGNEKLLANAIGSLWNPLSSCELIRVEFAESGGIELVANAMLAFPDNAKIQDEGYAPLSYVTQSNNTEVKVAFLNSQAVPALKKVLSTIPPWWDMQGMTWDLFTKNETVSDALQRVGLMETVMIGDADDFDGDDEEDELCKVQDAPFDVNTLLDKDLSGDGNVPGWFKGYSFALDGEQSAKKDGDGKNFLFGMKQPKVDQYLCLRVVLPLGGRGHLFGTVSAVNLLPTDEDLASNGSKFFGVGCPCPGKNCPLKDAKTRDEILAVIPLHGTEISGTFSLEAGQEFGYNEGKLRYPPLVPFFRGKDAKYQMTLRFCDDGCDWKVIKITAV